MKPGSSGQHQTVNFRRMQCAMRCSRPRYWHSYRKTALDRGRRSDQTDRVTILTNPNHRRNSKPWHWRAVIVISHRHARNQARSRFRRFKHYSGNGWMGRWTDTTDFVTFLANANSSANNRYFWLGPSVCSRSCQMTAKFCKEHDKSTTKPKDAKALQKYDKQRHNN